jgi:hypothetical protein
LTDTEARQFAKISTDSVLRRFQFPSQFDREDVFSQRKSLADDSMTFVREQVERGHGRSKHA